MKFAIASIIALFSISSFAGTYKLNPTCLEKVTKINEVLASSYITAQYPGKATIVVDGNPEQAAESGPVVKVKAEIKIQFKEDSQELSTTTEIMDLSNDCYIVGIKAQ